jgi:hypothetical protein
MNPAGGVSVDLGVRKASPEDEFQQDDTGHATVVAIGRH